MAYACASRLKLEEDTRNLRRVVARLSRIVYRADRELGSLFLAKRAR